MQPSGLSKMITEHTVLPFGKSALSGRPTGESPAPAPAAHTARHAARRVGIGVIRSRGSGQCRCRRPSPRCQDPRLRCRSGSRTSQTALRNQRRRRWQVRAPAGRRGSQGCSEHTVQVQRLRIGDVAAQQIRAHPSPQVGFVLAEPRVVVARSAVQFHSGEL